ncbi:TIGR04282 family arsenosugar biosynthesis glycosyltransferase [Lacinutrix sp. C3R15]|uniref:TIGR04282 family arsenosugar biosynthesis glycosyltransferase n=1 Tax=Flavobacteriaceae TaxID=49546 RepID=UPI001C086C93|nr:TIGR04282 family arsenosugar biosynthesis glycosyltransferase [Oceanihabitans sp. 1_MG-2023]MBU2939152.1 TIGR04282 family arsenosugar biosynthesis glycosyltransferase [Lacinutrix sp. C3R15]MDO6622468.1 TIGR04282 family arsenosugar biosynthesis glycosyltransferase [Oceanihabitans sp. 1_MG-2023]
MKNQNLIIIFTRNPELGKVKTRLAKTIGNASALKIYTFLLKHTEKTIRNIASDKAVYYSVKVRDQDIWDNAIYQKHQQKGDDLGYRMLHAFQDAFHNNYEKVVIVGSDLFDLKEKHIQEAFKKLENRDVVIGPAKDGGYYLLGMKTLHAAVFKNKAWGTSSVFKDTMKDLQKFKIHQLEKLNDIDTFEDMEHNSVLKKLINQND